MARRRKCSTGRRNNNRKDSRSNNDTSNAGPANGGGSSPPKRSTNRGKGRGSKRSGGCPRGRGHKNKNKNDNDGRRRRRHRRVLHDRELFRRGIEHEDHEVCQFDGQSLIEGPWFRDWLLPPPRGPIVFNNAGSYYSLNDPSTLWATFNDRQVMVSSPAWLHACNDPYQDYLCYIPELLGNVGVPGGVPGTVWWELPEELENDPVPEEYRNYGARTWSSSSFLRLAFRMLPPPSPPVPRLVVTSPCDSPAHSDPKLEEIDFSSQCGRVDRLTDPEDHDVGDLSSSSAAAPQSRLIPPSSELGKKTETSVLRSNPDKTLRSIGAVGDGRPVPVVSSRCSDNVEAKSSRTQTVYGDYGGIQAVG
ncbi:hypothetical protein VTO42DRAFT_8958 [Malbranchea cinnamomea]